MKTIDVQGVRIGPAEPLAVIGGPCQAESEAMCLQVGEAMRDRCAKLGLGYIFKASFDKANRLSIHTQRGPGIDAGLQLLERVRSELGVPTTTDVHEPGQAEAVAGAVDLLQIPAFLCRQTDLLVACAQTGKPVNVKKGQFMSPAEMRNVVTKLTEAGAGGDGGQCDPNETGTDPDSPINSAVGCGIMLTERGTFFGYNRLVNDFIGLGDLMELGWPVCFDVTHSTQQPGGEGTHTGGRPERGPLLARAAVAAGVQCVFIETHPDPSSALSDAATMQPLDTALTLLEDLAKLHDVMR